LVLSQNGVFDNIWFILYDAFEIYINLNLLQTAYSR